jgi:hypothetical protein
MPDLRKISEMRNLGPAVEKDLIGVGITTAQQVIDLGAEETFVRMLLGRQKIGRSDKCCNALYLYAIHGAIKDIDWRELPEKLKQQFKDFTAELRDSGQFS